MSKKRMVATICMNSLNNKESNIKKAKQLILSAKNAGADWILLPEMFTYIGPYEHLIENSELPNGPLNLELSKLAKQEKICIFAGTVPELPSLSSKPMDRLKENPSIEKVYNTLYGFSSDGKEIVKYRKTHLFSLDSFSKNQKNLCESDGFLAGDEITSCIYEGWNMGFAICYDIRFPSLTQAMCRQRPLDILFVPAAFTKATGSLHWVCLLRARAIELQCYVVASNQVGKHQKNHETFGHSLVISPYGEVIADSQEKEGFVLGEVDLNIVEKFRNSIPISNNKRTDLY